MTIRRREFIGLVGGAAAWPLAVRAQRSGGGPKVALIIHAPQLEMDGPEPRNRGVRAFLEAMRNLGWIDGQNIQILRWSDEGRSDHIQSLVQEAVRVQVDAIVTTGGFATRAAKQATATIPIIMAGASTPVESGLIASLARPGGNVTGLTFEASGAIIGKRLELLKELAPKVANIAVLGCTRCGFSRARGETEPVARALALTLRFIPADTLPELEKAFLTITQEGSDAVFVELSPVNSANQRLIIDFMAMHRRPAIYALREDAEAGGLIMYGVDFNDLLRRSASYVDKILRGAKPSDLPVEQPTKFELVINLKTAKALGLTIPATVLARADEVIE
jgi:ABC-type uncharacterized transport system substrate-binding protein